MNSPFDATPSMLGYLFQVRVALADSIPKLRSLGSFTIGLETLEDVVFAKEGRPLELLQAKHHSGSAANLSDASSDLWKTLRIWADGLRAGRWGVDTVHYLATTSAASADSAASMLRSHGRNPLAARDRLNEVARASQNSLQRPLYDAYLALSDDERLSLLERLVVLDRAPDIGEIEQVLRQELTTTVSRTHLDSFVSRLEGWWFKRVVEHLRRAMPDDMIRSEELDAAIDRLRDQFRPDNLPIDDELTEVEINEAVYVNRAFVAQLTLLRVGGKRLIHAMRHYYSASEQRSRWLREGILRFGELGAYDRRLCQEWDIHFAAMLDEVGEEATEEEMVKAARALYKWAEQDAAFQIRSSCDEPFVCRGSLQMLADSMRIGWHPQFVERLKDLVKEAS